MKIIKDISSKLINWYSLTLLLSVWVSVSMVSDVPELLKILFTILIVFFFLMADSLIRIKIESPLVPNKYILFSLVFFVSGLLLSLILSKFIFFFLLIIGGLLYFQRYLTERLYLIKIFILALLAGCTFWLSGIAIKPIMISYFPGSIFPSLLVFLFTIIYLFVLEASKIEENESKMIIPLIERIKSSQVILISIVLLFSMILLSYLPILDNWYSSIYKIIFVYIVELPLLGFLIFVWGNPTKRMFLITGALMKLDILLGFTALYFS